MGKAGGKAPDLSRSLSSSSSTSSQDFEFTISLSPTSRKPSSTLYCPADELFFKGQLLPLHLPPRLHIIHALSATPPNRHDSPPPLPPLCFSNTACNAIRPTPPPATIFPSRLPPPLYVTTNTTSIDSSGWSSDATSSRDSNSSSCDSSRRTSSATTDEDDAHLTSLKKLRQLARLPLKKPPGPPTPPPLPPPSSEKPPTKMKLSSIFLTKSKKMSRSAKNVFQKYINKMKPLYEKISHQKAGEERFVKARDSCSSNISNSSAGSCSFHATQYSQSFSGNLNRFPKKGGRGPSGYIGRSCPSSMGSSPSHSGVLTFAGEFSPSVDSSSMEELQSAIQGAIAHCKNSNAVNDK